MKKIFTFLFSSAIITSALAQIDCSYHNQPNAKETYHSYTNDPRYERDKEIEKINYLNNFQVQQLVNDACLNIWEKRDALNALESQRIQKVNTVYRKYNNSVAYYTSNERNNSFERMYRQNSSDER